MEHGVKMITGERWIELGENKKNKILICCVCRESKRWGEEEIVSSEESFRKMGKWEHEFSEADPRNSGEVWQEAAS